MFRRFSVNFGIFSMFLDGAIVVGSLLAAREIRPLLNASGVFKDAGEVIYFPAWLFIAFPFIWVGIYLAGSIYDGRKYLNRSDELTALTLSSGLAVIATAGVLYFSFRDLSRALFVMFNLMAILLLVGWRGTHRWIGMRRRRFAQKRRVLIVGEGSNAREIREIITNNDRFNLEYVGSLGAISEQDHLGNYSEIEEVVSLHEIDHVVVALPRAEYLLVNGIVDSLSEVPVKIWVVPDYYSLALYEARTSEYAGLTLLDLRAPAISDDQRMVKRIFDLIITILICPIWMISFLVISLLIMIFDPGPILFNQIRAGENGRPFRMHKFRTMMVNSGPPRKNSEGQHKVKDDPRITKIGKILRKTSLDEIPQIINVVKGEMSMVGPRPEMLELVDEYEGWQRQRFAVPPGITGWWQINGRSNRPMHLHTEDDLFYIKNYSIWLDLQILIRTIWVVLIGRGAY